MLIHTNPQVLSFSSLDRFPNVICRVSTRMSGDLWMKKHPFKSALPILLPIRADTKDLILMEQTHSSVVNVVNRQSGGTQVPQVDGMVTSESRLFLGVNTADCVPLFFFDPIRNLIGVAHAGWRGTIGEIATKMVNTLCELGSKPKDILVAIGPHIGPCCYNVSEDRAKLFSQKYSIDSRVVLYSALDWFIDLGQANRVQLLQEGVLPEHIDAPIVCTCCQNDIYFSYRKDTAKTFGEMLGIIGLLS